MDFNLEGNALYLIGAIGGLIIIVVIGGLIWLVRTGKLKRVQLKDQTYALSANLKDEKLKSGFIINAIEDGVVTINNDLAITSFNPAAETITGWSAAEARGIPFGTVLKFVDGHGQPFPDEENPIVAAMQTAKTVRDSDVALIGKNDKSVSISIVISPLNEPGRARNSGVVAVFRDITHEKAEERQRDEFISTASHEMRTPIAAIEGYLALALNEKVTTIDANARNYLEKAHSATKHLGLLFQDLLTSSKAEDGRLQSYPTVLEMGEMLQQVTDDGRFNAEKKGLGLEYVFGSAEDVKTIRPLYYVFADQNRVREVLQNLIDNAIKYTMEGKITVRLTGDENTIQVQVSDTGQGISADDIPHLFQKFYRVDNSMTRSIGGTGLGLFICRKIIELYNGRIWVSSEMGKGSTFFINLPRVSREKAIKLQQEQAAHMSVLDVR